MNHSKELRREKQGWGLGFIEEFSRVGLQSGYRVYQWVSNAFKAGFKLCVRKMSLNNDEILSKDIH